VVGHIGNRDHFTFAFRPSHRHLRFALASTGRSLKTAQAVTTRGAAQVRAHGPAGREFFTWRPNV
jgi:hypothetical protein